MNLIFLSIFPELLRQSLSFGLLSKAEKNKIVNFNVMSPRDFALDQHKSVDDRPYGGGSGMLMLYPPMAAAIESIKKQYTNSYHIHFSPRGKKLTQKKLFELSKLDNICLVSSRYEGVDQRFINQYIDEEISLGDYVLMGGELPSLVFAEGLVRLLPGVLGNKTSILEESFDDTGLCEAPQFSRPANLDISPDLTKDKKSELGEESLNDVPKILLSGHHKNILQWKDNMRLLVSLFVRPDLLSDEHIYTLKSNIFLKWLNGQTCSELQSCGLPNRDFILKKISEFK